MPFLAVFILALALGSDSFSVSIGFGMRALTKRQVLEISAVVGIFHVFMPVIGLALGRLIGNFMGQISSIIGPVILFLIGLRMIAVYNNKETTQFAFDPIRGIGLFLFALGVSIDALSTGISLGLHGGYNIILVVLTFGLVALAMTASGLYLGHFVKKTIGQKSELLGGIVLILLSIYFFLT